MDTWSGLYLREELGRLGGRAAGAAFMAFSAALFLGRLFAGRVLFGLGRAAHDHDRRDRWRRSAGTIAALTSSPRSWRPPSC